MRSPDERHYEVPADAMERFRHLLQTREWRVHCLVLCANSTFFEKLCCGTFKEADDRKTYLDDDDPLEVSLMLTSFYAHDYEADCDEVRETDSAITGGSVGELEMNVRMWTLGDKYGCMHLQYFALTSMITQFKHDFEFGMKDFLAAVKYTYEIRRLEDDSLRVRLVEKFDAAWRCKELGQVTKEFWMELVREVPEFMSDLMVEHTKILGVSR